MGEPLEAAQIREALGELEEAARLYEAGGDRIRAAELYEKIDPDKAIRLYSEMRMWERQVATLVKAGKLAKAAQTLEAHGQLARAVDLYEQAGQIEKALAIEKPLGHWMEVARLAEMVKAHEDAAQAYEHLGQLQRAAEACVEAGKVALAQKPVPEERVSCLYEQAARMYDEIGEDELAYACRRVVRQYRRLPELDVRVLANEVFVELEYNDLDLEVTNRGYGLARRIAVDLRGEFDIDGVLLIRALRPQKSQSLKVSVRPHKGHFGKVPLLVSVTYEDPDGNPQDFVRRARVQVEQQGLLAGMATPTPFQINIQELYQRGAKKVDTEVHDGGQVGDKVEINRGPGLIGEQVDTDQSGGGGPRMTIESGDACVQVRRNGALVRRCPVCNVPEKDPGQNYCSDCGAPLGEIGARAGGEAE